MNSQFWPQPDGSIVDIYWRTIPSWEKRHILETVHSLPAREKQDDFLHALSNNRVIIVQWETGSGKTTQLPKFAHQADPTKRIVVTQPRVLSAKSNAWRVSDELLVETGNAQRYSLWIGVWYRTGPEKNSTKDTRFLFNTDATEVLRQVVSWLIPDLLFLDEVHNFSTHTEVAAMVARKRADAMSIVIMSATLDPEIFREYFKWVSRDIPLIQIPGRTFWVEADYDAPWSYMTKMSELVRAKKNILFFAPWKKEIEGHIEEFHKQFWGNVMIFPLHSEMPRSEQDKLLKKHGDKPYIIVSTNVAEESITIPYIDAVVDLWTHKVMRYDQFGNPTLFLEDTAYANAKQRAGRSWRTKPGEYFRFNFTPSSKLLEYPEAPIEKEMIDRQILALLAQWTDIVGLVEMQKETWESPFFHSVNTNLFDISLGRLQNIWALTKEYKLTELGYELLKFPVDVYHARMLYEAISRWTLDTIIPMVAILEKKWFVSKDSLWKEFLTKETYSSDLVGYYELFQIVTSPTLSRKHERLLIEHGADPLEIADFRERDNGIKLYEVVDLSCIGIKNKKVKEIDDIMIYACFIYLWWKNEEIL
jgi:HrpA-like RNA helicase